MSSGHLPHLLLEEIVTGERKRVGAVQAHLRQCRFCVARLGEMEQDNEAFLLQNPPVSFVARLRTHPSATPRSWSNQWLGWGASVGVLTASLLVALVLPKDEAGRGWRTRGSASLQIYRLEGDHLRPLTESSVPPGTKVRFAVQQNTGAPVYACAFHREDGRVFRSLSPSSEPLRLSARQGFVPGTFLLTQTPGPEYLVVALGTEATTCTAVAEALGNKNALAPGAQLRSDLWTEVLIKRLPKVEP